MELSDALYLSTKIRPPRAARGLIARPRLDAFLEQVRSHPLTVLSAPAGFGKTSLALSWAGALAGQGARVAWLSLGAEDDNAERFLRYVAAAVRHAGGERAEQAQAAPDWLVSDLSIPIERRVEWLVAELSAQSDEIYLFLDDYQEIAEPDIDQGLSLLIRRAAENVHVVILSRSEPGVDLAWMRSHDAVFELDAAALRFDLNETQQLLRRGDVGPVLTDEAALLNELTGGWIAALRATLLTLRAQKQPAQYLRRLPATPRSINALFVDLLENLPPGLVDFMECISVCERQSADLAESLSGRSNAQALLEQLERQQLFLICQDDEGRWFAFHRLFREFLQRRLNERPDDSLIKLHRSAARWFAREGLWSEAIQHAFSAGFSALAVEWMEAHAMAVVGAGDLLTLMEWERLLRSRLMQSPRRLRLAFAWGLGLAMDAGKAADLLDGVEAELADLEPDAREALASECTALRSLLASVEGDYETSQRLAESCVGDAQHPPWVRNAVRNVIASCHMHADRWDSLYAAAPVLGDAHRERPGDRMSKAYRLSIRGLAEYRQGHLERSASLLQEAMTVGASAGLQSAALVALPAPTLALIRYEQDRIGDAARINAAHMDVNRRIGPMQALLGAYQVAARVARLEGQSDRARSLLDEAEEIGAARGWRRVEAAMLIEKVRFCLLDGRLMEASACAQRIGRLADQVDHVPTLERRKTAHVAALASAWCALADAQFEPASNLLAVELAAAQQSSRRLDEARIATALALARLGAGDTPGAVRHFIFACSRAQPVGALRAIVDQPISIEALTAAVRSDPVAIRVNPWLSAYVAKLDWATREPVSDQEGSLSAVETLSPRERGILKLVSEGLSNKEIAKALGITPETVKSHVKNIFAKLGVSSRAQAAAMVVER